MPWLRKKDAVKAARRGSIPYAVIAAHLDQELALPPRQRGSDYDDPDVAGEVHSPIGLSRHLSGDNFNKVALTTGSMAFIAPSDEEHDASVDSNLNAD